MLMEKVEFYNLFEKSPLPMWIFDVKTLKFLDVNLAAVQQYGYSKAEFLDMKISDIRPKADIDRVKEIVKENAVTGLPYNNIFQHCKKNGDLIFVEIESNLIDYKGIQARIVSAHDITQYINSQKQILESVDRYNIVSKATRDAIWDYDLHTQQISWNKGIKGILKYKAMALQTDMSWWENRIHPDDQERVLLKIRQHLEDGEERWEDEYRFLCGDGEYRHIMDRGYVGFDENKKPYRMIGAMQDITENKKHVEAIEKQNQQLLEIAWIQSHQVRAPLARIMAIVDLLVNNCPNEESRLLLEYLAKSSAELDGAIANILKNAR